MGMSASQARLIQLTARMSDLELEGQQINQQRLNLANQSAAIQEEALRMDVPTAPSVYDYPVTSYTGKTNSGKDVQAALQDDGSLLVGVWQDKDVKSFTGDGTSKTITQSKEPNPTPVQANQIAQKRGTITVSYPALQTLVANEANYANYSQYINRTDNASAEDQTKNIHNYSYSLKSTPTYIQGDGSATQTYTISAGQDVATSYQQLYSGTIVGSPTLSFNFNGQSFTPAQAKDLPDGYDSTSINKFIGFYKDDKCSSPITTADFDSKTGKMTYTGSIYEQKDVTLVDGKKAYTIDEARAAFKDDSTSINELVDRIKSYETTACKSANITEALKDWFIVDTGSGFEAVKKTNATTAKSYDKSDNEAGYKMATVSADNLKTDALGNITGVTVQMGDGSSVKVTLSKQTTYGQDNPSYMQAMANYENKKAEYDRAQENANNEVKKLQTIDKQLELKLKRLDTERNALNTEIDAVKKVIQDNTDKSFKTFSG